MAVLLAKRALPRTLDAPPPDVAEQLAQLPLGFGQQALDGPSAALNLKKLAKPQGAWRLRTGDWRSIFFPTGDDFLVAAIGLRKDIYERVDRMRLARRGDGVTVLEAAAPRGEIEGARTAAVSTYRARGLSAPQDNGFSPFDDAMLCRIEGVSDPMLGFLRSLPSTVDAPAALADELDDVDLAFLLVGLLGTFDRKRHQAAIL